MINVEIKETNKSIVLRIEGHAGHSDVGKDIICASASILAYTVGQMVSDFHKKGMLQKKPTVTLKSGKAVITAKPTSEAYDEVLHTYYVANTGYKLLAHNYPQYVKLTTMFGES